MSERRVTGDPCPLDEVPLRMAVCQPCRFFRGAAIVSPRKAWSVTCNWPRDGSFIDQRRIPSAFEEAFAGDGDDADPGVR